MVTKKTHTAELAKLVADLPQHIDGLEQEIAEIAQHMDTLKKAGLIYANEHWRKDSEGQPKYFYLLYPQKQGEQRRRDYIGCDQERIESARRGIERAAEYDQLAAKLGRLTSRVYDVANALQEARRHLTRPR